MRKHIAAQIGHHTFADGHDVIISHGAGDCQNHRNRQKHGEIAVDHRPVGTLEPVIDDAANGKRQGKCRGRGQNERKKCRSDQPAISLEIRKEAGQRSRRFALCRFLFLHVCHGLLLHVPT